MGEILGVHNFYIFKMTTVEFLKLNIYKSREIQE